MKRKNKYQSPRPSKRQDWKNETEDEIILMQEEIDELSDELGLSEEAILKLEKIVDKFKERMNDQIDLFEVTTEIAMQDKEFVENFIYEMWNDRILPGETDLERMTEIITNNGHGRFIKTDSLVQDMRLDEIEAEFRENPYQLKLIA